MKKISILLIGCTMAACIACPNSDVATAIHSNTHGDYDDFIPAGPDYAGLVARTVTITNDTANPVSNVDVWGANGYTAIDDIEPGEAKDFTVMVHSPADADISLPIFFTTNNGVTHSNSVRAGGTLTITHLIVTAH